MLVPDRDPSGLADTQPGAALTAERASTATMKLTSQGQPITASDLVARMLERTHPGLRPRLSAELARGFEGVRLFLTEVAQTLESPVSVTVEPGVPVVN